ncbi:MAG TPA: hypothetical protein VK363_19235 [Pyrinomonadaceae bacterium]|nr:hypothetical protein [Pyrinomonadaceae bacterium]
MSETDEEKQQRTPRELARVHTLAARSQTDLSLLHDSVQAVGMPFVHLAKVKRAQAEIKNLLREIAAQPKGKV